MSKYNIHNTNTKIKTHILSDENMKNAGFEMDKLNTSWSMIKPLTKDAELWFEVWGEGEDDFQIEVTRTHDIRPYMSNSVKSKFEEEMSSLQRLGVISGYEVGDRVFRCTGWRNCNV